MRTLRQFIERLDPERHVMLLSVYGSKAQTVLGIAARHAAVVKLDSMSHQEIAEVDVNLASLLPAWAHVCVPSKAVTAICCGSSLLLNASRETDAWRMFERAAWLIEPATEYSESIDKFVSSLTHDAIAIKRAAAREIAQQCIDARRATLDAIVERCQIQPR